jgi:hypothetical protein
LFGFNDDELNDILMAKALLESKVKRGFLPAPTRVVGPVLTGPSLARTNRRCKNFLGIWPDKEKCATLASAASGSSMA